MFTLLLLFSLASGRFLMSVADPTSVYWSDDGAVWTASGGDLPTQARGFARDSDGNVFVASVGQTAHFRSPDGGLTFSDGAMLAGMSLPSDLAFSAPQKAWVIVGGTGVRIGTSIDGGNSWTAARNVPLNLFSNGGKHVAYSERLDLWVACGAGFVGECVGYSRDREEWTMIPADVAPAVSDCGGVTYSESLGKFILAGGLGAAAGAYTSEDGVTWEAVVNAGLVEMRSIDRPSMSPVWGFGAAAPYVVSTTTGKSFDAFSPAPPDGPYTVGTSNPENGDLVLASPTSVMHYTEGPGWQQVFTPPALVWDLTFFSGTLPAVPVFATPDTNLTARAEVVKEDVIFQPDSGLEVSRGVILTSNRTVYVHATTVLYLLDFPREAGTFVVMTAAGQIVGNFRSVVTGDPCLSGTPSLDAAGSTLSVTLAVSDEPGCCEGPNCGSSNSGGLPLAVIIGIAAGCAVVLGVVIVLIIVAVSRRRRNRYTTSANQRIRQNETTYVQME